MFITVLIRFRRSLIARNNLGQKERGYKLNLRFLRHTASYEYDKFMIGRWKYLNGVSRIIPLVKILD